MKYNFNDKLRFIFEKFMKKAEPFDAYLEFGYRQVATVTTSKNSPRLTT